MQGGSTAYAYAHGATYASYNADGTACTTAGPNADNRGTYATGSRTSAHGPCSSTTAATAYHDAGGWPC
jgi:hypothetical protein